jgi:cysteinyl-tRNA synthetase
MALRIYNTLTRKKHVFKPVRPGQVGMYVCGPTVYKPSHIGHMVGPVIFDTVKRYLTYRGYKVQWVVNVTDVDDKLIVRARELNTTVKELAEKMTADYLDCLRKLNVTGIDAMPRATEHIPGMIAMMQGLIDKGYAYASAGDVYFDVTKNPDYGKLCNRDPEQLEAGARIEVSEKKRNPGDFALWKGAKPGEPAWDSPWGPGRPGWHIECSVMSMKLLGTTLDIHGGGLDLQFPHHENELAQSESYSGQPFARFWMHNGLLKTGNKKMAKSGGNEAVAKTLLGQYPADTIRLLILSTHYRSPIEFNPERLAELNRSLGGFYRFFDRFLRITGQTFYDVAAPATLAERRRIDDADDEIGETVSRLHAAFLACMDDDFNTAAASGVLFELLTELNRSADDRRLEGPGAGREALAGFQHGARVLKELSQILGLFHAPVAASKAGNDELVSGLMQLLIDLRAEAREAKNFAVADQIRKRLAGVGVTIEDHQGVTTWRCS